MKQEAAVPFRFELRTGHEPGPRPRRLHQRFFGIGLRDEQEPARLEGCDPRQGCVREPLPFRLQHARLEPQLLGKPEHVVKSDGGSPEPVLDLPRIGRDALQGQQHGQRRHALIGFAGALLRLNLPGRVGVTA